MKDHYVKAIENIEKAMDALYCVDDELKTVEIYLDLRKTLEKLKG